MEISRKVTFQESTYATISTEWVSQSIVFSTSNFKWRPLIENINQLTIAMPCLHKQIKLPLFSRKYTVELS